ncbi:hypothetical protein ETD85_28045 [Nonomuraea zeae]|uniref:Uncharacterized protein n=1 Tax=Nonomuraea zeae TaxID=1642303 RepID=A0A5S4GCT4_9ACTN|nr:hypothetical protein ETD85_28045 [Nonomuraea zeae]
MPFWVYLAGVLAAFGLAYLIDGRERGAAAVLAATLSAQAVLHQLFERLSPGAASAAAHAHPAAGATAGMVIVHLTVAALTAWWLHRGERALWLMIRLYAAPRPVIPLLVTTAPEVTAPSWWPVVSDVPVCGERIISSAVGRRGPPAAPRHRR